MSKTGRVPNSLSERLTTRLSEDRERIEQLTLSEQRKLASNLENAVREEFARIRSVISEETALTTTSVRKLLRWPLWTAAMCVILVVISLTTLWGVNWWMRQDLIALRAETLAQKSALQSLMDKTGGVEILSTTDETYVILPKGTNLNTTYGCSNNRPCLKLPR